MRSQRFFIGNLPANTKEIDVRKAFNDYGEVTSIVLKEKENLVDPGSIKVLAFVTLNLFDGDLDFCLRKLNAKPINGEYVRVSEAKESFLERLKREREENSKSSKITGSDSSLTVPKRHVESLNNSKKFFNIEEEDKHDEKSEKTFEDEELLITKKRASTSMRNGKIFIEGTNSTPVHIIGNQKETRQLSEKSFESDKKRKASVNKKKNQYQLQKSLIQNSLTYVDTSRTKKIIYDDDDDAEEDLETSATNTKPLFQEDPDQDENSFANDFALKSEYEGPQGAALMKLKSHMNLDPRFKIDHKFVEKMQEEPVKNNNSERDWQFGILEQVVGRKVTNTSHPKGQDNKKLKMLRYDPSKDNQDEFLIKHKKVKPMEQEDENIIPTVADKTKVSKEVFYMVSDNLSNSLKTRGDGFSLLSMFGNAPNEDEQNSEKQSKEKILISKNEQGTELNPFTYDSTDSENEQNDNHAKADEEKTENGEKSKQSGAGQTKLFVESFFIPRNDVRLKEGKSFFYFNQKSEKTENYDDVKHKLKAIINTKINKSKRQLNGTIKKKSVRGRYSR